MSNNIILLSRLKANTSIKNILVLLDHELTTNKEVFREYDRECFKSFKESLAPLVRLHDFRVEFFDNHSNLFDHMILKRPDFIINLVNYGYMRKEKNNYFSNLFSMLDIPFLNAGTIGITLTDNKNIIHRLATNNNVPTPVQEVLYDRDILNQKPIRENFPYPAFLKLRNGRGSCGITEKNIIFSSRDLYEKFPVIHKEYLRQSELELNEWILQEYLPGAEYNVTVLGNDDDITIFPIIEIVPGKKGYNLLFQTRSFKSTLEKDPALCAVISMDQELKIKEHARVMYKTLECRDYCRIEFRCDKVGIPKIIDVNPLSSYGKHEAFALAAYMGGVEYEQLWKEILYISWKRYGLITF